MLTDVLSEKKEKELIKETSSEQIIHPNFHIPEEKSWQQPFSPVRPAIPTLLCKISFSMWG